MMEVLANFIIKIISANVQSAESKKAAIEKVLDLLDPDILGFQES